MPQLTTGELDSIAQPYVRDGWCPALVVAVQQKETTLLRAYGSAPVPLGENAVFEIGSVSKAFTRLLLSSLVDDGIVGFDDPVTKVLPVPIVFQDSRIGTITLRQLAERVSGLQRDMPVPDPRAADPLRNQLAFVTVDQLYAFLSSAQLRHQPGEKKAYSNVAYVLLAHILELAAGEPFETLLQQRICRPLGMTDTSAVPNPDQLARLVPGHDADGRPTMNGEIWKIPGAGGIFSTSGDLLKFACATVRPESSPLGKLMKAIWPKGIDGAGMTCGYFAVMVGDAAAETAVVAIANAGTMVVEWIADAVRKSLGTEVELKTLPMLGLPDTGEIAAAVGSYRLENNPPPFPQTLAIEALPDGFLIRTDDGAILRFYPETGGGYFDRRVLSRVSFVERSQGVISRGAWRSSLSSPDIDYFRRAGTCGP